MMTALARIRVYRIKFERLLRQRRRIAVTTASYAIPTDGDSASCEGFSERVPEMTHVPEMTQWRL